MPILISQGIIECINQEIEDCKESFYVISAFCKTSLIEYFDSKLSDLVHEKKLIVRMKPEDIIKGATDLSLYDYCKFHGWTMYFRLDLHAKTYIFDTVRCIVGSANATNSGLSVGGIGNYEMAMANSLDNDDRETIKSLFTSSIQLTDSIYELMKRTIEENRSVQNTAMIRWPDEIVKLQKPDFSIMFTEDFPNYFDPFSQKDTELGFWGDMSSSNKSDMRAIFEETKCYLWLKNVLEEKENHEIYFGEATVLLHSVLLNDPKPYRREVKELLSDLLNWIQILECRGICIDRPNHSQRIRLVREEF